MTTSFPNRAGASTFSEPMRRFSIGQSVRLLSGYGNPTRKLDEVYRITALMPAMDASFQYRLRQDGEAFERMATEESLDPVRIEEPGEGMSPAQSAGRT
ncbi:hypothetical protein [Azorhizobium caulinodans]|uniref:hypothetical protein n=1 Tax=Azorhizobium caulinodans TaxID=7 RepID=UPI002FBD5A66